MGRRLRTTGERIMIDEVDVVTIQDIGRRLGLGPRTPQNWRQRGQFPEPDWTVSNGTLPLWDWSTVKVWLHSTGRTRYLKDKGE